MKLTYKQRCDEKWVVKDSVPDESGVCSLIATIEPRGELGEKLAKAFAEAGKSVK